jgi:chorismate mutase
MRSRRSPWPFIVSTCAVCSLVGCAPVTGDPAGPTSGPAAAVSAAASVDAVVVLLVDRLETAPAVAAAKYFSGQPVADPAREQVVLDAVADSAEAMGADPASVRAVFTDQISASKEVQQSLLDQWAVGSAPAPESAPDLATDVRPVLDALTPALVEALAELDRHRSDPQCPALVAERVAEVVSTPEVAAALPASSARLCSS